MFRAGAFFKFRPRMSAFIGTGMGTSAALFGLWSDRSKNNARWALQTGVFCLSKEDPLKLMTEKEFADRLRKLNGKCCGEDSYVIAENRDQIVLAIADGVGGWRKRGIDPSKFSRCLMDQVKELVNDGSKRLKDVLIESDQVLQRAFHELVQVYRKKQGEPFGSSTAVIVSLKKQEGLLDVSNLGDSGVMVVRDGSIIFKSVIQQTRFNAPYQATLRPNGEINDMTPMADKTQLSIQDGDIILVATDGLWDNVWEKDILQALRPIEGISLTKDMIDAAARDFVMLARDAAGSEKDCPFAVESQKNGKPYTGGKPDDITVIVAVVVDRELR